MGLFSHEWTNYPDSEFESGYSMVKVKKCDFLSCLLENDTFSLKYNLLKPHIETVYIIDPITFVHIFQYTGAR